MAYYGVCRNQVSPIKNITSKKHLDRVTNVNTLWHVDNITFQSDIVWKVASDIIATLHYSLPTYGTNSALLLHYLNCLKCNYE